MQFDAMMLKLTFPPMRFSEMGRYELNWMQVIEEKKKQQNIASGQVKFTFFISAQLNKTIVVKWKWLNAAIDI